MTDNGKGWGAGPLMLVSRLTVKGDVKLNHGPVHRAQANECASSLTGVSRNNDERSGRRRVHDWEKKEAPRSVPIRSVRDQGAPGMPELGLRCSLVLRIALFAREVDW